MEEFTEETSKSDKEGDMEADKEVDAEVADKAVETAAKKTDKRRSATYNICITAMFVAIIAVCAWLAIPISAISITLQTMGVCLAAALLGWKRGVIAVVAYILLGLVGVPVFTGPKGGVAVLAGVTGGYIVGFLFTALIVGIVSDLVKNRKKIFQIIFLAVSMVVGIAVCYAFGTGWFVVVYGMKNAEPITVAAALDVCVFPYIIPDLIKVAVATALAVTLKRFIK